MAIALALSFDTGSVNADERATLLSQKGVTGWFTGLSASGKVGR